MFSFFRRHQRVIFLVVTSIIILSFSFFGTYSAVVRTKTDDPVLFTTLQGHKVKRSECAAYLEFLSSSSIGSGEKGLNFFNDGFLEKDILSTCVGESVFAKWSDLSTTQYLTKKKEQERTYRLYQHPQAPFLSTEYVWTYFAPELKDQFTSYLQDETRDPLTLFKQKAALFVTSQQCPGAFVKQLLLYQQKQASWLEPDSTLESRDLSLFGYHTAQDWFGDEYLQHVLETVMNGADIAEKEGISISDAEVLSSLYSNVKSAAAHYSDLSERPLDEVVQISLRSLGMDMSTVKKIWKTFLLYRLAYTDLYDHVAVSSFPFKGMLKNQSKSLVLDTYSLQTALRVHSTEDLAEVYLWKQAVLPKTDNPLAFSEAYRSPVDVMASFPEFVQERFTVSYRMVGPEQLEARIKLKDLWAFQKDEQKFALLAEKFPRLLEEKTLDGDSRIVAIESLPHAIRDEVEQYSKKLFIQEHPAWITEAMKEQSPTQTVLFLRPRGSASELPGISNPWELASLLRQAPLNGVDDNSKIYSQDGEHFYEFLVKERSEQPELVPLVQLREDGTLLAVLKRLLESQYPSLRKQAPKQFLKESGEWKPFAEVRSQVLDVYLAPLYAKLDQSKQEAEKKYPYLCQWSNQHEARLALFTLPIVLDNKNILEEKGDVVSPQLTYEEVLVGSKDVIDRAEDTLFDFVKSREKVVADKLEEMPQLRPLFEMKEAPTSMLLYQPKYGTTYVVVAQKGEEPFDRALRSTLYGVDAFIANSARRQKIELLLQKMKI